LISVLGLTAKQTVGSALGILLGLSSIMLDVPLGALGNATSLHPAITLHN
jgi:hypothetical protein